MLRFFRRGRDRDEAGASAVEYGLLIAAVAAVIVIVVMLLGGVVKNLFDGTCDKISQSTGGAACASDG